MTVFTTSTKATILSLTGCSCYSTCLTKLSKRDVRFTEIDLFVEEESPFCLSGNKACTRKSLALKSCETCLKSRRNFQLSNPRFPVKQKRFYSLSKRSISVDFKRRPELLQALQPCLGSSWREQFHNFWKEPVVFTAKHVKNRAQV